MPKPKATGRPRRWCSARCRRAASRRRTAEAAPATLRPAELRSAALSPTGDDDPLGRSGVPDPLQVIQDGQGEPLDQLATILRHLQVIAARLHRIAPDLPPVLRARAGSAAQAIVAALDEYFAEVDE